MTRNSIAKARPQINVSNTGTKMSEWPMPFRHYELIAAIEAVLGQLSEIEKLAIDLAIEIDRSKGARREYLVCIYEDVRQEIGGEAAERCS